jgi:hypothetical protein
MSKIDKHLVNLTRKRREKTVGMKKGISQQIPMKSRGSRRNILKTYIQINWKIWKK